MNTEIQPFEFENNQVRALADGDEVMFVASDIAKILGYGSAKDMARNLDSDEKGTHQVPTLGGTQNMTVLTESGLYRAILNREIAYVKEPESRAFVKRFQRWVTHEVLPAIRKTGGYIPATETESDEDILSKAVLIAQKTIERKNQQLRAKDAQIKELEPKAQALDAFTDVEDRLLVRDAAKILSNSGTPISEKQLREWMTANDWIYKHNGSWHATAKHCTAGHLVMVMSQKHGTKTDGTKFAFPPTVRITRKGLALLHKRLGENLLADAIETTTH
nr:MAG: antirepressor protein KilAC domain [Bacteriophage sp.]